MSRMNDTTNGATCSCGNPEPHRIASRVAYDGVHVVLWSDGAVTGLMGIKLPGVPIARPKTPEAVMRERSAGWMLLGEVCIYNSDELGDLYKACRWAAQRGGDIGMARARMNEAQPLRPNWEVYQTDRDGKPTLRVWKLPRIAWPGLAVWDTCGGPGSSGGRYDLVNVDRHGVCTRTGLKFSSIKDLAAHLAEVRA